MWPGGFLSALHRGRPSRTVGSEAGVEGSRVLCSRSSGQLAVAQTGMDEEVLGTLHQGHPGSCLGPTWYGPRMLQGALHLCHTGEMAGALVITDQGCPIVCHVGAA